MERTPPPALTTAYSCIHGTIYIRELDGHMVEFPGIEAGSAQRYVWVGPLDEASESTPKITRS